MLAKSDSINGYNQRKITKDYKTFTSRDTSFCFYMLKCVFTVFLNRNPYKRICIPENNEFILNLRTNVKDRNSSKRFGIRKSSLET